MMAELEVRFTLDDDALRRLRRLMRRAGQEAAQAPPERIIGAARGLAAELAKFKPPEFVTARLGPLRELLDLLEDEHYAAPQGVRKRILSALAYFSQANDLIPDSVPGFGFLDDAILIELVVRDLAYELRAYRAFRRTADRLAAQASGLSEQDTKRKLAERRRLLRARVREQERKSAGRTGRRFWLW